MTARVVDNVGQACDLLKSGGKPARPARPARELATRTVREHGELRWINALNDARLGLTGRLGR